MTITSPRSGVYVLRKGLSSQLKPDTLTEGELGFNTDTRECMVGTKTGPIKVADVVEGPDGGLYYPTPDGYWPLCVRIPSSWEPYVDLADKLDSLNSDRYIKWDAFKEGLVAPFKIIGNALEIVWEWVKTLVLVLLFWTVIIVLNRAPFGGDDAIAFKWLPWGHPRKSKAAKVSLIFWLVVGSLMIAYALYGVLVNG